MISINRFFQYIQKHWVVVTLSVSLVCLGAIAALFVLRTRMPVTVKYSAERHSVTAPFVVTISQTLQPMTPQQLEITPKIEGSWQYKSGNILGSDVLIFTPRESFRTDTTYTVRMNQVKRVIVGDANIPPVTFKTEQAPGISRTSFQDQEKPVLAADHVFTVELSERNRKLRSLVLSTEPRVELEALTSSDDKIFTWRPKHLLPQGQEVRILLTDANSGDVLIDKTVSIAQEPSLQTPVTEHNFSKGDTATMVFNNPMSPETTEIRFSVAGKGSWKDDRTYQYTPDEVKPGMTYTYTIAKGSRTKQGGVLTQDVTRNFSTPSYVASLSRSPLGNELGQAQQDIRITFNQPVNTASAESRFRISQGTITGYRWEGNTMIVTVKDLGFQNTVTYSVLSGVEPIFGLTSTVAIQGSFTTELKTITLSVPYYRQVYAQSCEAASLRMALAYRGIQSSDWDILQKFGYAPRSKDVESNSWDDPQKQFVGDVNGNQGKGTGWGVYAEPVAAAARQFGRSAVTQYGVSASFLARQIYNDRPVILWGIWGTSASIQAWNTPDGVTASGPFPMHVRLVVGVKGSIDNPQGFYVNDPITGSAYWSANQLIANTQKAGPANQAVVIY